MEAMQTILRTWATRVALSVCAIVVCCALAAAPALATGKHPVIGALSSSGGGEVTVGAKINPEGLDTSYEIAMECQLREKAGACETALTGPTAAGVIPGGEESQEVSLNVTSLQAGSYLFGVLATNSAGGEFRRGELTIPPRIEPCSSGCNPYERPPNPEAGQHGEEAGARVVAEYHARQRAAEEATAAHEQELKAQEAARIAAETAKREAAAKAARRACVVPSLRGDSLAAARRALARAHCRLGKVSRRSRSGLPMAVAGQSPQRGRHLRSGAAVSVSLARIRRKSA